MLRDILSSRLVIAGLVSVVLVVTFSLLYSWHVERSIRLDEARTERILQQYENNRENFQPRSAKDAASNKVSVEKQNTAPVPHAVQEAPPSTDATPENSFEETIAERIEEIGAEAEKAEEAFSAEELRRQELLQQRASIHEQLKTFSPEGRTVHSSDDPQTVLQALALTKKLLLIDAELSRYTDNDTLRAIERAINTTRSLTPAGKLPVTAAAKIADSFEKEGKFEAANRMRLVIQNAVKNGDAVIKPEHLTGLQ